MKRFMRLVTVSSSFVAFSAVGMDSHSFVEKADRFFMTNVKDGLVNYAQIKKDPAALNNLINYLESAELDRFDDSEKLAFYINAYNLYVIKQIIKRYPVDSPMDIDGFFDKQKILVAGEQLTLNDLENKKIRTYNDPRVHFVLVCAARGCPKIGNFAFKPDQLEKQLDMQTKAALNDPSFIRSQGVTLVISEIFRWYRSDFGETDADLILFLKKYREQAVDRNVQLAYYSYDWKLNDTM